MWFCKAMVWDRDRDILTRAPLAGQLIGLVMTNILGAIHFSRAEDRVGVILAIFDLVLWLLALHFEGRGTSAMGEAAPTQCDLARDPFGVHRLLPGLQRYVRDTDLSPSRCSACGTGQSRAQGCFAVLDSIEQKQN